MKLLRSWILALSLSLLQRAEGQIRTSCAGSPCQNGALCEDTDAGYQCFCVDGYAGKNCEINFDDCQSDPCRNNAMCDDGVANYTCVCQSGFTGLNCEVNIDDCRSSPCQKNSTCIDMIDSFKCECPPPYRGDNCSLLPCDTTPCDNNAACENDPSFVESSTGFVCDCLPGFSGLRCEINIEDCDLENDTSCSGNGLCVDGIDGFRCLCQPGWIGDLCQLPEDDCIGHSCRNGGACIDQHLGYTCTCVEGYTGDLCERERDECTTWQPCRNGATCVDMFNDYRCQCDVGWHGKNCTEEVDECSTNLCENGAQCVDIVGDFVCECAPFYTGQLCETSFNPCAPQYNQCQNDALCITPPDGKYRCFCNTGFTGTNCEVNINECIDSPCHNNATCEDNTAGYTCHCLPGWTDEHCTTDVDDCVSQPCLNGAECFDLLNGFYCNCTSEYTGLICDELVDFCVPDSCYNNGICVQLVGDYECQCLPPYTGRNCLDLINSCESSPCLQMSTCVNTENGFECLCEAPYTGKQCELLQDFCASQPCLNGGSCQQLRDNWVCICPPYLTGRQCTDLVDYCKENPCLNGGLCINNEFGFRCVCLFGFTGTECEEQIDFCIQQPCLNSGNCSNIPGGFTCDCNETYTGELCESEVTVNNDVTVSSFTLEPSISVFTASQSLQTLLLSIDTMSMTTFGIPLSTMDSINSTKEDSFVSSFTYASQIIIKPTQNGQTITQTLNITTNTSSINLTSTLFNDQSDTSSFAIFTSTTLLDFLPTLSSEIKSSNQDSVPFLSSHVPETSRIHHIDSSSTTFEPLSSMSNFVATNILDAMSLHSSTAISNSKSLSDIEPSFSYTTLTTISFSETEESKLTLLSLGSTSISITSSGVSVAISSLSNIYSSQTQQFLSQTYSLDTKSEMILTTADALLESQTEYTSIYFTSITSEYSISDLTFVVSSSISESSHTIYDVVTLSYDVSISVPFTKDFGSFSNSLNPQSLSFTDSTTFIETDFISTTCLDDAHLSVYLQNTGISSKTIPVFITETSFDPKKHSATNFLSVTDHQSSNTYVDKSTNHFQSLPTLYSSYSPSSVLIFSSENLTDTRFTMDIDHFSSTLSDTSDYNTTNLSPSEHGSDTLYSSNFPPSLILSSSIFDISEDLMPKFTTSGKPSKTSQSEDYTSIMPTPSLPSSMFGSFEVTDVRTASVDNLVSSLFSFTAISSSLITFKSARFMPSTIHNLNDASITNERFSSVLKTSFADVSISVSDTDNLFSFPSSDFMDNHSSDNMSSSSASTLFSEKAKAMSSSFIDINSIKPSSGESTSVDVSQFSMPDFESGINSTFDILTSSIEVHTGSHLSSIYSLDPFSSPIYTSAPHDSEFSTTFHTFVISSSLSGLNLYQTETAALSLKDHVLLPSASYHSFTMTNISTITEITQLKISYNSGESISTITGNIHTSGQHTTDYTMLTASEEEVDITTSNYEISESLTHIISFSDTSLRGSDKATSSFEISQAFTDSISILSLAFSDIETSNIKTSVVELDPESTAFEVPSINLSILDIPTSSFDISQAVTDSIMSSLYITSKVVPENTTPTTSILTNEPTTVWSTLPPLTNEPTTVSSSSTPLTNVPTTTPLTNVPTTTPLTNVPTTTPLTNVPTTISSTSAPSCGGFHCQNGGTCRQDLFGVFCDCPVGFIGTSCQIESTACDGLTCENDGVCIVLLTTNNQQLPQCHCPVPFTGTLCDQEVLVYYPAFHGQSYLVFSSPGLTAMQANEIVLYIKTTQSNGLILFTNSDQSTESTMTDISFIQLSLEDGHLLYRFSCDGIITTDIKIDQMVNTGDVYEIVVRQMWPSTVGDWCSASVKVNMKTFVSAPVLTVKQPQPLGDIILGGYLRNHHKNNAIKAREVISGYIGCIQNLQINGQELDMSKMASSGMNVENCNVPVCRHDPCKNGATCHSTPDDWYCKCPVGYGGDLCETKLCEINPCVHGGSCVVLDDIKDTLCVCPYGRGGTLCELELKPVLPYFSGTQFGLISYLAYGNMHYVTNNFQIEFNLMIDGNSTENSLILYMGHTDTNEGRNVDYFSLGMLNGYLYMRFDLGSGPADIYSPDPIDLTILIHTVKLGRNRRSGWLKLDNQNNMTGQSAGLLTSLNIQPYLFVGGVDRRGENLIPSLAVFQDGLKGCVYNLKIRTFHTEFTEPGSPPGHVDRGRNVGQCASMSCDHNPCLNGADCVYIGASIFCNCTDGWRGVFCGEQLSICDVYHTCSSGSTCLSTPSGGYRCLCPLGKKGANCDQDITISDAMFLGDDSYMAFEPVYIKKSLDIQLQIKPSTSTGLLFYVALRLHSNSGDFLSVTMTDWNVELRFSLGSELNVIGGVKKLVKDEWQTLRAGRNSTHGFISINGSTVVAAITGTMLYLDTTTQFFLGGLPDLSAVSPLAFTDEPSGYEGCIREFVVNERMYELNTDGATSGCNILDCDNTPCGHMICKNGGICHVTEDARYNCTCTEGYHGDTCSEPAECLQHDCFHGDCIPESPYRCVCHLGWMGEFCYTDLQVGSSAYFSVESFLVYKMPDTINTTYTNISLSFLSTKLHGLILWHGQTYTDDEDYLGLGLFEGRVKLVWNLGWYSRTETVTNVRYNDGQWHSVDIYRHGQTMTLTVDDTMYESRVSGDFHQLDAGYYYHLGSFKERRVKQKTLDNFYEPFEGCIKDVRVQGKIFLFDEGEGGRNIQPCTRDGPF